MLIQSRRVSVTYLLLLIMYSILTLMTVYFLVCNQVPLSWDQSGYLRVAAQLGHALKNWHFLVAAKIFIWHDIWSNRPALHMLVGGIFASFSQFNVNCIVLFSNMFWVGCIIWGTFHLSEYLHKKTGLLSVFLLCSSYGIIFLFRDFYSELALTSGVLLTEYAFFRSNKLHDRKWSVVTLVCIFIAGLAKETFILYIAPLLACVLWELFYKKHYCNSTYRQNCVFVFLGATVPLMFIYLPIIVPLLQNAFNNIGQTVGQFYARPYAPHSIHYYFTYLYALSSITSSLYIIIAIVAYGVHRICKKKSCTAFNGNAFWIGLLLLSPMVVLTLFITNTSFRFIVPILPLLMIVCSSAIEQLPLLWRRITIGLVLAIGTINSVTTLIPVSALPNSIKIGPLTLFAQYYDADGTAGERRGFRGIQQNYNHVVTHILTILRKQSLQNPKVGMLIAKAYLNTNILQSYTALHDIPLAFMTVESVDMIKNLDYVITTTIDPISQDPKANQHSIEQTNAYIASQIANNIYKIIDTSVMPNGEKLVIVQLH